MFEKIKDFFMKIFGIKKQELLIEDVKYESVSDTRKEEFENNIRVSKNEEEEMILKLRKDFESGIILEEDLSKDDFDTLYNLYEREIQSSRESIQNYRDKILVLKNKIA